MSGPNDFSYDIALIGMAGRFPGAANVEQFWHNLQEGVEAISFFSDEELVEAGIEESSLSDPNCVKAGAILEDADMFDASFFGFTTREAEMMDPQHRLFLEQAWSALEDAGYEAEKYAGRIGVYAGESVNSYLMHNLLPQRELIESVGHFQTLLGNDRDHLATQVAYKLNLKGPCLTVQTACSTSLAAVHLACQSLLNRECDMALAGGVSVSVPQKQCAIYQEGGIISADGHCRAFDAGATGTIKGNGAGVVVLKRLADALADGDEITAVIKGSAMNNDGSTKVGYTAPSVEGQASVIEEALALALVEPQTIGYVEAHGTGTALGDPIELAALSQAFRAAGAEANGFCAIGSVKTNIGHLDAAAGVAGLIKTALALKHKQLPASLHYERPNPNIDFSNSPFFVNARLRAWEANEDAPRRAGVSSFGIGGTNVHVVLEEAPPLNSSAASGSHQLLTLSARTAKALEQSGANLSAYLRAHPEANLADVAYTLQVGRRELNHRLALVCLNVHDALSALESPDRQQHMQAHLTEPPARPIVFMFSGQGAQYADMARELYGDEPVFHREVDLCSEMLRARLGLDLREELFPAQGQAVTSAERLKQTFIAQPALFTVEYALAKLWMHWGLNPQALIGHSIGEYVAACLAGVFSLEDALRLVAVRGRLMQQMPAGAMLAVQLPEHEAQPLLNEKLSLAAVNGPSLSVLSGDAEALAEAERQLTERGVVSHRLHTSHAYHSQMMEPILDLYAAEASKVSLHAPKIPYISGLTGNWITAEEATDPLYWSRQLRETVRFGTGVAELLKDPQRILLEVGPGRTLSALALQQQHHDEHAPHLILSSLPGPKTGKSETASLLETLGQLWLAGVRVDWAAFNAGRQGRRVALPTYPFERQRYWIEARSHADTIGPQPDALGRKPDLSDWFYIPSWKRSVMPERVAAQAQDQKSRCLIFMDECGLGSLVAQQLERIGVSPVFVRTGERFSKQSDMEFNINPRRREDYGALLDELRASNKVPEKILHLWSVTPESENAQTEVAVESAQERGFYSLLFLAQALGEGASDGSVSILVVTSNVQEVTGDEILSPEKATVLGPCKVIPQEYPFINCRCADLFLPRRGTRHESEMAGHLLTELLAEGISEDLVAYRGRHRWVQIFEPLKMPSESQTAARKSRLRERGVYLLTGGPGDIDLALARYLAEHVKARLILNLPSDFPARGQWDNWLLTHDSENEINKRIRMMKSLEESGAELMLASAELSESAQFSALVTEARERFGDINGIFHTAAVTGGGMIQLKTPEMASRVFAPKVHGTLALQSVLGVQAAPLDLFVLFSTSISLTGVFGQVDYCAANAFQDAFARAHASGDETLTVAINWNLPQWENWQDSTLAGAADLQAQFAAAREAYGVSLQEGVETVARILTVSHAQVVVSPQDFQALIEAQRQQQSAMGNSLLDHFKSARSSAPAGGEESAAYAPPENEIERDVAQIWQELFGGPRIGLHDNFFALGGNSLSAIQLVSHLRRAFQVDLPLSRLFESPTVAELAADISEIRRQALENEEIERMLKEIEDLSPDELQAHLVQEFPTGDANKLDG
jgi:acyl transferase domain-containing protein/acyl carrier protein